MRLRWGCSPSGTFLATGESIDYGDGTGENEEIGLLRAEVNAPETESLQPPTVKVCASLAFAVRDSNLWQGRADAR